MYETPIQLSQVSLFIVVTVVVSLLHLYKGRPPVCPNMSSAPGTVAGSVCIHRTYGYALANLVLRSKY